MNGFFQKLRRSAQRDRRDAELREELQFHLREEENDGKADGLSPDQARSASRRELGNVVLITEDVRAVWTWPRLERVVQDLRFGVRGLCRSPGFTLVALLTLGLAVGAATVMYGVVDGVVLRPLPYPVSEQLVRLSQLNQSGQPGQFSDPNFDDLRAATTQFDAMAEYSQGMASVVVGSLALRTSVAAVSQGFFDVFATPPWRGRQFGAEELHEGGPRAAIVSEGFWRRHFGETADLSGAMLRVNGAPHSVVGVMPARFDFPADVDIWTPQEQRPANPYRTAHNWLVVARITNGLTLESARAQASIVARRLKQRYGDGTMMSDVALIPLRDDLVGPVRPALFLLLASVVLLLGVACANLATLLLARISARRRELAVRTALGAKGSSLLVPMVAESLIVASLGGLAGVVVAAVGIRAVRGLETATIPRLKDVEASGTVLVFGLLATILTAVVFATLAGWQARRLDLAGAIKDGGRGHTGGVGVRRLRHALVVAQLALSVVLLIGAGLLGRSLAALLSQDPGFRREGLLTIALTSQPPSFRITDDREFELVDPAGPPRQARLNEALLERLRALPGVVETGGVDTLPMAGRDGANGTFLIVRGDDPEAQQATTFRDLMPLLSDKTRTGSAAFRVASAGYFPAMGIPLVRGRLFDERDRAGAPDVALISESLAWTYWPTEDPIGARIQFGNMDGILRVFTVVGVVADVRHRGLDSPPRPTFYADYRQRPFYTFNVTMVLQTTVPPASLVADARRVIQSLSPDVAPEFRAIDDVVGASVAGRRFALAVTASFAAAAMLMAILGVYGVLSYLVTQRSQEFGVRIVLGARWTDIQRVVLGEAGRLIALGLAVGIGLTFAGKRVLEGMLFGIQSTDLATYLGVAALLAAVAFLACQVPAIRAARVDPVRMLRAE
jgi:putative ABC transport system permease protein